MRLPGPRPTSRDDDVDGVLTETDGWWTVRFAAVMHLAEVWLDVFPTGPSLSHPYGGTANR